MVEIDPAHLVGAGGAIGALCRHYLSRAVERDSFPLGVFTVNVLGSFVLGLLTFGGAERDIALFVGVGACGSFTTFSSFSFATVELWRTGRQVTAVLNAVLTLAGSLLAVGLAILLVGL